MTAITHPELYDAFREAGVSEPRARAAERTTLPAKDAATKAEVEKSEEKTRPMEKTLVQLSTLAKVVVVLLIPTFFFAVNAWISANDAAARAQDNRADIVKVRALAEANAEAIAENARAIAANAEGIAENRELIVANARAIAENAQAIAANARAIAENRAVSEGNSKKLDDIIRFLGVAEAESEAK